MTPEIQQWLIYIAIAVGGYFLRNLFPRLPFGPLTPSPSPAPPSPMPNMPNLPLLPGGLQIGNGQLLSLLLAALMAKPPVQIQTPPEDQPRP